MSWVQHGRLAKGSHLFDRSTEYRGKRNKILDYRKVPRFCYVDWLAGCRSEIRGPIDKNAFEITSSMYTYLLWSGLCIVCKPLYSDELSRKKKFIKGPSMTAGYLVCVYVVDLQLKISGDRRRLLFFHFFFFISSSTFYLVLEKEWLVATRCSLTSTVCAYQTINIIDMVDEVHHLTMLCQKGRVINIVASRGGI